MERVIEFDPQAVVKMALHAIRYPHAVCCGFLLSPPDQEDDEDIQVIDAMPASHASHGIAPMFEIAINSVQKYASDQDLVVSGYYQADPNNEPCATDNFEQRIIEKLNETYPNAILCQVNFESDQARPRLVVQHLIDGKFRRKSSQCMKYQHNMELICRVLYGGANLHRDIVDFDDHFNDISLDWTNTELTRRVVGCMDSS